MSQCAVWKFGTICITFMTLYQHDAVSVNVGERVRELRTARDMTMQVLAKKSGLSVHTLSMIELGKISPSVSALYKLADVLDVSITTFFSADSDQKQVIYLKSDERTRMSFPRGLIEGLGGEKFLGKVEPFLLTLENSANSGSKVMSHSGHEFVFCLRGELEYQVEHQIYQLSPGDSLLFAARLKHRWKNPGKRVATALIVISCFGEADGLHTLHHGADK
jgi:transcriptional regulator with XRE-family HTH domain